MSVCQHSVSVVYQLQIFFSVAFNYVANVCMFWKLSLGPTLRSPQNSLFNSTILMTYMSIRVRTLILIDSSIIIRLPLAGLLHALHHYDTLHQQRKLGKLVLHTSGLYSIEI